MPRLAEVIAVLDEHYPPALAEPWDAVGLVCGDPDAEVRRVLFAVDPVEAVVAEAVDLGADLLVTHHPLFLRPVHGVAATTFKGRAVHRLIRAGIALHTAHTNADAADPGVSDALAGALGLRITGPLLPASMGARTGIGRVGELPVGETLGDFARRAAAALPATAAGIRVAGDPARPVRRVAVCGGAGDSLFDAVRAAGVDAYLTADLRHHPASEAVEAGGPALLDAAHWATEWPWLAHAADTLRAGLTGLGTTVVTYVSTTPTDPWTACLGTDHE
jgi:dinuclear metal center YbgI/SA1388 family protein